jgi:hypothetical protein
LGDDLFGKRKNDEFKIGLARLQVIYLGIDELSIRKRDMFKIIAGV